MPRHLFLILVFFFAVCTNAVAQSKQAKTPPTPVEEKPEAELEGERLLRERRANAQSLLINLATDARYFTDDKVRARSLARIADMLWESDRERSRSLFRSAWDAAESGDANNRERVLEEIRQIKARNPKGGYSLPTPSNLRREVLDLVLTRDRALADEFLKKYAEQKLAQTEEERSRRASPSVADEATAQRLDLARNLAHEGELEHALQFADSALRSITMDSVDFLVRLREKYPAAADQRYAAMVAGAPGNSQSDANTVALLAAYIFTPGQVVVFLMNGGATMRGSPGGPPANVSADLRAAFFRTATAILLRPLADQTPAAIDAHYLALRRMMPLLEQNAPPETLASVRAQFENLSASATDRARSFGNQLGQFGLGPASPKPPRDRDAQSVRPDPGATPSPIDREQSLLDERERAKTPADRDLMNARLAIMMVDQDDRRARDYVDRIDDMELRNSARAYVDASIAYKLTSKKDIERALELARTGALTHFQRAWLLALTARQMRSQDRDQFLSLIDYAATEARRIQTSDPDRARAFMLIANVVFNLNRPGIWEIMNDAIKAANSAETFTGEDGEIVFRLDVKGINSGHQHRFSDFDVAGIFTKLANEDYDKAVELARGFQNAAPRTNAVIAIARSVLVEKKK
jgi:hypothetical protein